MAEVEFYYNGKTIKIQCNKNDIIRDIFNKFKTKSGTFQNSFIYLYNGHTLSNETLTFYELANLDDRNRKKMNIVVSEASNLSLYSSQFNYEKCKVLNDEMKEFAEIAILYAMKKCPDDDYQKCLIVKHKFEEKYGGIWPASFIKGGNSATLYYDYWIKLYYEGYLIKIGKTSENK